MRVSQIIFYPPESDVASSTSFGTVQGMLVHANGISGTSFLSGSRLHADLKSDAEWWKMPRGAGSAELSSDYR
jgi:hypothetical protein